MNDDSKYQMGTGGKLALMTGLMGLWGFGMFLAARRARLADRL